MSGHSKWSTIKRAKGATDAKRSSTFTKVSNAITIATKLGGSGDIDSNPKLRLAVELARSVNMPKDNVARAIDRGLGKLPGQQLEEVLYEGFGPGKVAFLVDGVTDNKLRTLSEVRNLFDRAGGAMGGTGSVSYMFDQKGEIKIKQKDLDQDEQELELIDLGIEDLEGFEEDSIAKFLVYTSIPDLNTIGYNISEAGYEIESSAIVYTPNMLTEITDSEVAQKVLDFAEKLEDNDDVQKVYSNLSLPDNLNLRF